MYIIRSELTKAKERPWTKSNENNILIHSYTSRTTSLWKCMKNRKAVHTLFYLLILKFKSYLSLTPINRKIPVFIDKHWQSSNERNRRSKYSFVQRDMSISKKCTITNRRFPCRSTDHSWLSYTQNVENMHGCVIIYVDIQRRLYSKTTGVDLKRAISVLKKQK